MARQYSFSHNSDYVVTCVSFAFSFIPVWYLTNAMVTQFWYTLAIFTVMSLFIMAPLIHLEQVVGYLGKANIVKSLKSMFPMLRGIGYVMWVISVLWVLLICRQASLSLLYFGFSIYYTGMEHAKCGNEWNLEMACHSPLDSQNCREEMGSKAIFKTGSCQIDDPDEINMFDLFAPELPKMPAALEYFMSHINGVEKPNPSEMMERMGDLSGPPSIPRRISIQILPTLAVFGTAAVAFFIVSVKPRILAKLSYFFLLAPIGLLVLLNILLSFVHDFTRILPRDLERILIAAYPVDCATLLRVAFLSSSAGMGVYSCLAGLTRHKRLGMPYAILTPFLSVLSVPLLSFLCHRPVLYAMSVYNEHDVNVTAIFERFPMLVTGMEQVILPSAFAVKPMGALYACIFYSAIFISQMGTLVLLIWAISSALFEWSEKLKPIYDSLVILAVCVVMAVVTMVLNSGSRALQLGHGGAFKLETCVVSTMLVVTLMLAFGVCFRYGWHNVQQNLSLLFGIKPEQHWMAKYLLPASGWYVAAWLGWIPVTLAFCLVREIGAPTGETHDWVKAGFAVFAFVIVIVVALSTMCIRKAQGKPLFQPSRQHKREILDDQLDGNQPPDQTIYNRPLGSPRVLWCLCHYKVAIIFVIVLEILVTIAGIVVVLYLSATHYFEVTLLHMILTGIKLVPQVIVVILLIIACKRDSETLLLPYLAHSAVATGVMLAVAYTELRSKWTSRTYGLDPDSYLILVTVLVFAAARAWGATVVVGFHWWLRHKDDNKKVPETRKWMYPPPASTEVQSLMHDIRMRPGSTEV